VLLMNAPRILAAVSVVLALAASLFFVLESGTAERCTISTPGERECRQVKGETLIEREGTDGAVILAVPVALALAVLLTVVARRRWAIAPAVVLLLANVLALASVGLLYLPATLCALTASLLGRREARG
jgi:hypothetical protein